MFSKIKRGIVEDRAVDGLRAILENSKVSLNARVLSQTESPPSVDGRRSWRRWKVGGARLLLGLCLITAFVALYALGNYRWNGVANGRAPD